MGAVPVPTRMTVQLLMDKVQKKLRFQTPLNLYILMLQYGGI